MLLVPMLWAFALTRVEMARKDDRGEITEKVIIIAVFVALAIAVGAIIVAKVTDKANAISL